MTTHQEQKLRTDITKALKKLNTMKTAERTYLQLCEEIDDLKEDLDYYKKKYEQEVKERYQESNERLQSAKKDVANALLFALSVSDNEKGDLVIKKSDRKILASELSTQ